APAGIAAAHRPRPQRRSPARERPRAAPPGAAAGLFGPARRRGASRRLRAHRRGSARGLPPGALMMEETQYTILLVEDDRILQRTFAEALHSEGFTVLAEHDGQWARSTFAQRQVNLIIADILLPGLSGLQLAQDVRRTEK